MITGITTTFLTIKRQIWQEHVQKIKLSLSRICDYIALQPLRLYLRYFSVTRWTTHTTYQMILDAAAKVPEDCIDELL